MTKMRATLILLLMVRVYTGLIVAAKPDVQTLLRVSKARFLFSISVAPSGHALLFYRSAEVPEGEVTSGTAVLVKLKPSPKVLPLEAPSALEDLTLPVWGNGHMAYFLTSTGIYSVDTQTSISKPIVRGALAGLAISPDGTRLAFWKLGAAEMSYTLSVLDISSDRIAQSWKVPIQFDSDQYGHEIVFSNDGSSILARTYDEEERTPLERFDIGSGRISTVWPNCSGLARASRAIYFIGDNHGVSILFKLVPSSPLPQKIEAPFPFDSLLSSGTHRWVIAVNNRSRTLAVLDSETNELSPLRSGCENAAVLADGQVVCSRGGDLVLASALPSRDGR